MLIKLKAAEGYSSRVVELSFQTGKLEMGEEDTGRSDHGKRISSRQIGNIEPPWSQLEYRPLNIRKIIVRAFLSRVNSGQRAADEIRCTV